MSVAAAGFLIFIIALAVVRLFVFCALWALTFGKHHFWLFPNLTEDVGFLASFWPIYQVKHCNDLAVVIILVESIGICNRGTLFCFTVSITTAFGPFQVMACNVVFSVISVCHRSELAFTYILAPWSRVLLEKLTGSQLVKKFPTLYGIQRFIITLASARHL